MTPSNSTQSGIDPRGPRFAAWVTSVVLFAVLVTGNALLLAAQAVVFALGAFASPRWQPYGVLYRTLLAPRLAPPAQREDPAPVRFSQGVGLIFAVVGVVGYASGLTALGVTATAMALGAAFLNAAFGFCLGCEIYHRLPAGLRGLGTSPASPQTPPKKNESNTERGAAA